MKNNTTKYHPMLYATPMVLAILEGRKTQTRRIIKDELLQNSTPDDDLEFLLLTIIYKYKVGDVIWVRETFRAIDQEVGTPRFEYKATENINRTDNWKPSLFMPKQACRIFLKIKSIRVERLQDIRDEDAIAEGIDSELYCLDNLVTIYENYLPGKPFYSFSTYSWNYGKEIHSAAEASFCSLWENINGDGSWNKNPFVWVYEFERTEKPLDFIV